MGLNKQKKEKGWCPDQSEVPLETSGLIRCPTCNKRLAPRAETRGGVVVKQRLPPHKEK